MGLELVHTTSKDDEKGWIETTIYRKYFYNRETMEVTLVETVDVDNPYRPVKICKNKEISRRVLNPAEVPPIVREKIAELLSK
jgi:hypothetical protein